MTEQEFVYNTTETLEQNKPKFAGYSLVDQDDPILVTRLENFDFSDTLLDPVDIASKLIDTAKFHKSFSVAANQVGLTYKVFVAGNDDQYVAFFNPELISPDTLKGEYVDCDSVLLPETDLSNMGLMLRIKRPKTVFVQYQDYTGETKLLRFDGLTARIVQQNIDRLNGIDFKSRVSKYNLDKAVKSLNKKIKKYVRSNIRV